MLIFIGVKPSQAPDTFVNIRAVIALQTRSFVESFCDANKNSMMRQFIEQLGESCKMHPTVSVLKIEIDRSLTVELLT